MSCTKGCGTAAQAAVSSASRARWMRRIGGGEISSGIKRMPAARSRRPIRTLLISSDSGAESTSPRRTGEIHQNNSGDVHVTSRATPSPAIVCGAWPRKVSPKETAFSSGAAAPIRPCGLATH